MELFSYTLSIHTCGNLSRILVRELAEQLGVTEDTRHDRHVRLEINRVSFGI